MMVVLGPPGQALKSTLKRVKNHIRKKDFPFLLVVASEARRLLRPFSPQSHVVDMQLQAGGNSSGRGHTGPICATASHNAFQF